MKSSVSAFSRTFRFLLLAAAFAPAVFASQQKEDEEDSISPETLNQIQVKSTALLRDLVPKERNPQTKTLETPRGEVLWGTLFGQRAIFALVNLSSGEKSEPDDHPPKYLTFYEWKQGALWRPGKWEFRQYLGNWYDLEIHHRKDRPSHFLQGKRRTGRYEGDFRSWYYDEAKRQLVPTGFEDWGPIFIAGDYLCRTRGFERLAHWETTWVYEYAHGKMGHYLGCMHEDDEGRFAITFRDGKSGQMKTWFFRPDRENESRVVVGTGRNEEDEGYDREKGAELTVVDKFGYLSPHYCFQLLTGLNPAIIDDEALQKDKGGGWRDTLPKPAPLKRIAINVEGNSEIRERFQWPQGK